MSGIFAYEIIQAGRIESNSTIIWSTKTGTAIVVDPTDDSSPVIDFLKEKKLHLKSILHTHGHFDHIGDSKNLKDLYNAKMYLHKADIELYQQIEHQGKRFGIALKSPANIDHFLNDGDLITLDETEILKVIHTPGHTMGSVSFFSDLINTSPILISGDTLFHSSIGRTDLPGGNYRDILDSIKNKLFTLPKESIVIPGHGETTTIGYEISNNPYLR